jgi:hypothetical protein
MRKLVVPSVAFASGDSWASEYWIKDGKLIRKFMNDENRNSWTVTLERLE